MIRHKFGWLALFVALAGCAVVACGHEPATFNFDEITKDKPFRLMQGRIHRALQLLWAGTCDALRLRRGQRARKLHMLRDSQWPALLPSGRPTLSISMPCT